MFDLKESDYSVILQPDGNVRYERATPMTVNDRINQMTVEEKARSADIQGLCVETVFDGIIKTPKRGSRECMGTSCRERWEMILNSPYKEADRV